LTTARNSFNIFELRLLKLAFLPIVAMLFHCSKEQELNPSVNTIEVIPTSSISFIAHGDIREIGNSPILDYGFAYTYAPVGLLLSANSDLYRRVSLGTQPKLGLFQKEIFLDPALINEPILVTALPYIINERRTIYGQFPEPVTLPSISISLITPITAKVGDNITINGRNFSPKTSDNKVSFNSKIAKIIEVSTSKLIVEVPDAINTESPYPIIQIYIKSGWETMIYPENFKLIL